jgi:hypothetical protein
LWKTNGAAALALLALVLPACTGTDSSGSNSGTTVSEVAKEPNSNFIGKTVTVSGEVEKVISPKAFTIEGDHLFNDPELLVVNLSGSPIVNDSNIQVTGTVHQFLKSEIESQFDLSLAFELAAEFRGKPVLVATAVTLTPQPGEIAEEPKPFIGKTVTVSSKVAEVLSPNAFTLDDQELIGGKELLVVGAIPAGSIDEGKTVRVTASIRQFVIAEIERDFDLDLQPELKVEYEGKPVAIAQSIQIVE